MGLFQAGDFTLASGQKSRWKIECDALTYEDWDALALMLVERLPCSFSTVLGVPRGGIPFAEALSAHIDLHAGRTLVVDDVWTTGGSMERFIDKSLMVMPMRAVAFARGPIPADVIALFGMSGRADG